MIPRNIDLTSDGDFANHVSEVFVNSIMISEAEELAHEMNMTFDQFQRMELVEKVFGKRRHTGHCNVFDKSEHEYREDMRGHCARCGKEFRVPWESIYGVCARCNEFIEYTAKYEGFPWVPLRVHRLDGVEDDRDILSLR